MLEQKYPIVKDLREEIELVWINPDRTEDPTALEGFGLTMADIDDAEARLARFAPFLMACFPETRESGGIIESVLF